MIKSVALTFALVASSAQAGFVHTDWKYTGDEEAVLHEETGIEWLTMLNSQTNTVADTNTQLQDGYYYDGWRYATLEEVDIMMSDFFGEAMGQYSVSGDDTLMKAAVENYISMFGITRYLSRGDFTQSFGVTLGADGNVYRAGVGRYLSQYANSPWELNFPQLEESEDVDGYKASQSGFFLVSDGGTTLSSKMNPMLNINNANAPINNAAAVPVFGVAAFGLLGLIAARRRV